jgi:crossover junction endodeoxyribonuclease RusA
MSDGVICEVELPWPPKELSPNARVHWGKKSKAAKRYRADCFYLCKEAGAPWLTDDSKLQLHIEFCPPDRRAYDDDNLVSRFKSGRDGVADALRVNDKRFVTHINVGDVVKNGSVKIKVVK